MDANESSSDDPTEPRRDPASAEASDGANDPSADADAPEAAGDRWPAGSAPTDRTSPDEASGEEASGETVQPAELAADLADEPPAEPTELPEPPEAFVPDLDAYSGPLDLLLYLIHKNEVDILDIPISLILDQYMGHLKVLREADSLDLFEAGEFLVMAARLMEIKSRLLLPTPAASDEEEPLEEELVDPRRSLVQQLLEYKEIKERAILLEDVYRRRSLRYERPPEDLPELPPDTLDLSTVSMWELAAALQRALAEADRRDRVAVIEVEDRPIEEVMQEVATKLTIASGTLSFSTLFDPTLGRRVLISYFLAVLELAKVRMVKIDQSAAYDDIQLTLQESSDS